MYNFYITPDDYLEAQKHGISSELLNKRIRDFGWNKHDAITKPVREKKDDKGYLAIAVKNGINPNTFWQRVGRKWSFEKAATTPTKSSKEIISSMNSKRIKYPKDIIKEAESNGISYSTFVTRVNKKWTLLKAATTPVMTSKQRGELYKRCNLKNIERLWIR